jgi:glycosyltransferase involved in cell wall biosynthesis
LAIKASKLYYDWDMKHSSKRYIGWLFIALVQFAIVGALKHNVFGLLYLATFLVVYWYYIRWYIRKRFIVNYYEKSGIHEQEVVFRLTEEGLWYDEVLIDWEHIFKVVKFDDGILLQTLNHTLFFEKEAFESYDELQRFMHCMRKHEKVQTV